MIGILIATHFDLGKMLIEAGESIVRKKQKAFLAISNVEEKPPEKLRAIFSENIKKVDSGSGVLILTDMFGGTPSNISYSFLKEGKVEVLSGVNLPVVIRALNKRPGMSLEELAADMEAFGKKSISLASGILKGKKASFVLNKK